MIAINKNLILTLLLCILTGCCHIAKIPCAGNKIFASRINSNIKIDGKLDESAWGKAECYYMVYHDGRINLKIRDIQTSVRLLWNDKNLYIAFSCRDNDIFSYRKKRDSYVFWEDCCEVMIAPKTRSEYAEFVINSQGVLFDAANTFDQYNNLSSHSKIDFAIQVATSVNGTLNDCSDKDRGWVVEMAIPWHELGENNIFPGKEMYGNFLRFEYGRPDGEVGAIRRQISNKNASAYAFLNIFPTYIKQWPHLPGTFGRIILK